MNQVKDYQSFMKKVNQLCKQKNAKIFSICLWANKLKIATERQIQLFDFSAISEHEKNEYIQQAIIVLKQKLPQQLHLFDEYCQKLHLTQLPNKYK